MWRNGSFNVPNIIHDTSCVRRRFLLLLNFLYGLKLLENRRIKVCADQIGTLHYSFSCFFVPCHTESQKQLVSEPWHPQGFMRYAIHGAKQSRALKINNKILKLTLAWAGSQ